MPSDVSINQLNNKDLFLRLWRIHPETELFPRCLPSLNQLFSMHTSLRLYEKGGKKINC